MDLDRYRGSELGLAVGDAIGAPVEFKKSCDSKPVTGMTDGGTWSLPAGYWTDDTSLALCLAESLLEKGRFELADQLDRYLLWHLKGHLSSTGECFDIGITTRAALNHYVVFNSWLVHTSVESPAGNSAVSDTN